MDDKWLNCCNTFYKVTMTCCWAICQLKVFSRTCNVNTFCVLKKKDDSHGTCQSTFESNGNDFSSDFAMKRTWTRIVVVDSSEQVQTYCERKKNRASIRSNEISGQKQKNASFSLLPIIRAMFACVLTSDRFISYTI
jgi:hypothetical protein